MVVTPPARSELLLARRETSPAPSSSPEKVRERLKALTRSISLPSQCVAFSHTPPSPPQVGGRPGASNGPEGHLLRGSPSGCRGGRLIAGSTAATPKAWFIGGKGLGGAGGSARVAVLMGTGTARTRLGSGLLLERLAGLLEVGDSELNLILNLEVGGEHAGGSRDLRVEGVLSPGNQ